MDAFEVILLAADQRDTAGIRLRAAHLIGELIGAFLTYIEGEIIPSFIIPGKITGPAVFLGDEPLVERVAVRAQE